MPEFELERYRVNYRQPDEVRAALGQAGIALFDGIFDREELSRAADAFMSLRSHRDAESDAITNIRPDREREQRSAGVGFSRSSVLPHTEGTSLSQPPGLLLLVCARPARHGGETILVDGQAIYRDLLDTAPDALEALSRPAAVEFGVSAFRAPTFGRRPSGEIAIRYRDDDLVEARDPSAWNQLRSTVSRHQVHLMLGQGQGFLLDNTRWLHGRTSFSGDRHMYRLIGDLRHESRSPQSAARSVANP